MQITENEEQMMKTMEWIQVQAASGQEATLEKELYGIVKDLRRKPESMGLLRTDSFRHASLPGCFLILMVWETETPLHQGSIPGINLKETMKTFGLVNHSVWINRDPSRFHHV
jgi:hypothetical protein